jgi:RNA polymerase sigma-70 factor (ECF subfamily)
VIGSRLSSEVGAGSPGDAELIGRLKAGDLAAFDEIVARYKNRIYNYVYRLCRRREAAEDITQEVFVRLFIQAGALRPQSSFTSWLYRVAGNLCIDEHRRMQTRRAVVSRSLDQPVATETGMIDLQVPDRSGDPERELLRDELESKVEEAVDSLPDKMRVVLLLNDQEGLSYEEIAGIVKIPVGTVKSRLFNARMALKEALDGYICGSEPPESKG